MCRPLSESLKPLEVIILDEEPLEYEAEIGSLSTLPSSKLALSINYQAPSLNTQAPSLNKQAPCVSN